MFFRMAAETPGVLHAFSPASLPISVMLGLEPVLSGLKFWTKRMTLIQLPFRRFAAGLRRRLR
jgi:hypothetical protein